MAMTIPHATKRRGRGPRAREESFVHFLARECQWILRILVIASAAATLILMITIPYPAFITAFVLLVSYCALLIADYIEYRTHHPGDPGWEQELSPGEAAAVERAEAQAAAAEPKAQPHEVRDAVKARLTKTIIGIFASIILVAVIVAAIFLDRELLALGVMVLFAYWLFIAAPLWLGWLEDEAEAEAHRAEEELDHEHPAS